MLWVVRFGTLFRKVKTSAKYKPIRSLLKGLKILEAFSSPHYALSFQELTVKTGMPKASVFRFLQTLLSHDYLSFDAGSKKYFMGPRVLSLGFTVLSGLTLKEVALPYLEALSREADQNINLAILDRADVVIIQRIQRWQLLTVNLPVGSRVKAYQSSCGRAILAFLDEAKWESLLEQLSGDPEAVRAIGRGGGALKTKLEEVRRRGYALNDGELIPGVRAIAAPLFNAQGEVEGAINLPVFSHSVTRKELVKRYVPLLLKTARDISMARGYKASPGAPHGTRAGASPRGKRQTER
jgi:IclR family transcriptional regulator, pca regulon regulatory protein